MPWVPSDAFLRWFRCCQGKVPSEWRSPVLFLDSKTSPFHCWFQNTSTCMGREALYRFRCFSAVHVMLTPVCYVCVRRSCRFLSRGRSKGTLAGGAAYHPTSKMVNITGRGTLGATPTRLDMVSRREHNQHMATRTSVRAPPLFSIAVSRGYMWKRANT